MESTSLAALGRTCDSWLLRESLRVDSWEVGGDLVFVSLLLLAQLDTCETCPIYT